MPKSVILAGTEEIGPAVNGRPPFAVIMSPGQTDTQCLTWNRQTDGQTQRLTWTDRQTDRQTEHETTNHHQT